MRAVHQLARASLLALAIGWPAFAQQPLAPEAPPRLPAIAGPLRLTPDSAAALAVDRSADVAIAEQAIASARGGLRRAEAMSGWQVQADASYSRMGPSATISLPESMGGGELTLSPSEVEREAISATKPLYLGGRDKHAQSAAREGIVAAQEGKAGGMIGVAAVTRQAVFTTLLLQQLSAVAQQRLTAVAEHLRVTTAMFNAGTVARFEVVQAETEQARAKGDVIKAQTAVAQAKASLAQLLNVPQGTEIIVEEGVPPQVPEGDLHQLIQTAFGQRPELNALEAAVRAAKANLRLAQANDRPTLAFQSSVAHQPSETTQQLLNWSVTLALTKPIFQGGATQAMIMQAQAALQTAKLNVEKTEQQIALQVTQAVLNIGDAKEALRVAEQGEVEAQERLRIADVRYRNGVSLGVEVLDAQTALAAAQTAVINARYDLQIAVTSLRAALGFLDVAKESK